MNGRFFAILLFFCIGSCFAASHIGYLAYVGPSSIRFHLNLNSIETCPVIDYNPKPLELTTNQTSIETNKTVSNLDTQSGVSPEFLGPPAPDSQPVQTLQTVPVQEISPSNQQLQPIQQQEQTVTVSDSNGQVITPQIFVNYFKQNPFLKTNSPTQVIVVPNFTPPPPITRPSSSATYTVR